MKWFFKRNLLHKILGQKTMGNKKNHKEIKSEIFYYCFLRSETNRQNREEKVNTTSLFPTLRQSIKFCLFLNSSTNSMFFLRFSVFFLIVCFYSCFLVVVFSLIYKTTKNSGMTLSISHFIIKSFMTEIPTI